MNQSQSNSAILRLDNQPCLPISSSPSIYLADQKSKNFDYLRNKDSNPRMNSVIEIEDSDSRESNIFQNSDSGSLESSESALFKFNQFMSNIQNQA